MSQPVTLLVVEDSPDDAKLTIRALKNGGFDPTYRLVQQAAELEEALKSEHWDAVISDYMMPAFTGIDALKMCRSLGFDMPFILVSGTIGEQTAVDAMKAGASDYVMKNNLARLAPALERELREAQARSEKQKKFDYLAYYDPVTGLANRTLFGERLAQFIASAKGEGRKLAVVVVELLGMIKKLAS